MSSGRGTSRRVFLRAMAAAGGGLVVGVRVPQSDAQDVRTGTPALPAELELGAWVVVKPDESVVIRVARSELGQGTTTGLAQLVAEELDCDWGRVSVEQPSPSRSAAMNRQWKEFSTANSRGIRTSQDYMRLGGATARWMLLETAAEQWKVPAADLTVENGIILHTPSKRVTTYGKLATAAAKMRLPDVKALRLKEPRNWRLAGRAVKRLDLADKLTGKAVYGVDVKLPGMLNAAIRQAPVPGSTLVAFDAASVSGLPGVKKVVRVGNAAVAVVAESWWQAEKAVRSLPVTWSETSADRISSSSIGEFLKEGLDAKEAFIGHTHGDALKAISGSVKKVEAVYSLPFLHQAALEPLSCTAHWRPGKIEVWAPTQNAEGALRAAAQAAGVPVTAAEFHRTAAGGSFGRRTRHDCVTQAVLIARELPGTPVKLIWSREEDTQHGFYRPIGQYKLIGGVDDKGELAGLIFRISGQSIIASNTPQVPQSGKDNRMFQGLFPEAGEAQIGYSVPNIYIDHAMRNTHVPVGSWRGVHCNQNAFVLESFIDELARAAERDPLDFRRSLMKSHPKHSAVLTAVAARAGWEEPARAPRFRGIAQCMSFGTYTAAVAEVSVDGSGRVSIHRLVMAVDCGQIVNPDQVTAQIEGSVAFALGAFLFQEITIRDGRVVERNFDTYPSLRLPDMPRVDVVLMPSGDVWGGIGSACVAVVAPAVANAVFAATGKRIRSLPLKNGRLA